MENMNSTLFVLKLSQILLVNWACLLTMGLCDRPRERTRLWTAAAQSRHRSSVR